ncbi:hypothetical protein Patl1_18474 [Pistacia atlantica]|uniref:Uncharacterized protein n=1 Tax=Pistacia atlantica TaxID=434234 RepID=A0ACC1C026_9ROSI|nr:hypothetical protein Patl1_18474 [Pistacia atlantica]
MGVAKAWSFSLISANLALLQQQNGYNGNGNVKHFVLWRWRSYASDLEWYSQRLVKPSLYSKLREGIGSRHAQIDIWKSNYSNYYYGCSERSKKSAAATSERSSNGYLLIAASGGLNQQRTGITDAVVVARILNTTLVVPELDHHSYWKDDSEFVNIFDVNHFISSLSKDVTIVKRVPDKVMRSMEKPPYTMRVPRKSTPEYYLDQVPADTLEKTFTSTALTLSFKILTWICLMNSECLFHFGLINTLDMQVVQLTKFDYRLANDLDEELQKLRCRVNYHALRFTKPIQGLGQKLVMRMRKMAKRFIAVHLRFVLIIKKYES